MVSLKLAELADFDFFYRIKSDEDNMYWCGHAAKPRRETLLEFFRKNIIKQKETSRTIYMILAQEVPVGYLYVDIMRGGNAYLLSIAVLAEYSGKGYGTAALNEITSALKSYDRSKNIFAFVREDNKRSRHLFEKCGFTATEDFKMLTCKTTEYLVRMIKYAYKSIG